MVRNLFVTGLVLAGLALASSSAQAFGRKRCNDCDTGCAPACEMKTEYVEKTVTCYKPEWKERDVTCTINRMVTREEVSTHKCTVMVPEYKDEKHKVLVSRMVPKEIEREVTVCKKVRETCVDECGRCYTVCRRVAEVHKVKCCVRECVQEEKEVTVRVCTMRPEEKTYQVKRLICETKPETVVRKEKYCVMVPYETKVKVAVCKPVCCN